MAKAIKVFNGSVSVAPGASNNTVIYTVPAGRVAKASIVWVNSFTTLSTQRTFSFTVGAYEILALITGSAAIKNIGYGSTVITTTGTVPQSIPNGFTISSESVVAVPTYLPIDYYLNASETIAVSTLSTVGTGQCTHRWSFCVVEEY